MSETVIYAAISDGQHKLRIAYRYGRDEPTGNSGDVYGTDKLTATRIGLIVREPIKMRLIV